MGCDIHLFIENKNSNGKWQSTDLDDNFLSSRNYIIFALLANVRNNYSVFIKPIHQNSGLPTDCSHSLRKNFENSEDYHSPHWISTKELFEIDYQSSLLNWLDYSGYNDDYDSYPLVLQKYFKRRPKLSKEQALNEISFFCTNSFSKQLEQATLYTLVGASFFNAVKELYEKYPEGRLVFYFDN